MSFRRAAKVDSNQKQIVRELRAKGFRVDNVSQVKKLYDLVVTGKDQKYKDIRTVRVEIKSIGGTLTYDEIEYHRAEPYPETLLIAYSTEEILEWFHYPTTSQILYADAVSYASVDVVGMDTTHTTRSYTTSKRKVGQSIKNSTTPET